MISPSVLMALQTQLTRCYVALYGQEVKPMKNGRCDKSKNPILLFFRFRLPLSGIA
jgi:hypothetical protein